MANARTMLSRPRRYFALHYYLLRFLGLGWWHHPDEADTRNFRGWYFYYAVITETVLVAGFIVLESIDPFIGEKELDRFMFSLSFVITHDLTLIKIYIFVFKNQEIQDTVRTLEIGLQEYYQNNEKNRRTIKITRILTASFVFFGWMTIVNTNIYGIIQDIRWKNEVSLINDSTAIPPRTLPQPIYIPWNYQTEKSYIFTFVIETVGLLWTGHIVLTIDTFIGSIIFHMSSQFKISQEAFMTAYDRTIAKLSEGIRTEESTHIDFMDVHYDIENNYIEHFVRKYRTQKEIDDALEVALKDCFKQHQLLISCVEKFAKTYSYGFMTQLLSSTAAICVVMVQVSKDASSFKSIRLVTSLAFFVAMIVQLAIQCFTGSELTYQASRVSEAVMQCKWELMPPRLRVLLIVTIARAQKPLRLTAAGFAYMDNDCFLAILKAAYSYYAVLSQKQV